MAYCTWEDVQKKIQTITITNDSHPSQNDVTEYCDQISADMNSRFEAAGINLPITDANKLKVVKSIAVNGVIAEVLRAVEMEPEKADIHQKLYDNAMDHIEKLPGILKTGTTYASPAHGFGSYESKFKREEKVW